MGDIYTSINFTVGDVTQPVLSCSELVDKGFYILFSNKHMAA